MENDRKYLAVFVLLLLCIFFPPISSKPFPLQETSLVVREVITITMVTYLWFTPVIHVSTEMLGRVMNSLGEPIDGSPKPFTIDMRDVNGSPLNPTAREYPRDFIQTGISVIDGLCSLVRGHKLPIFSASGTAAISAAVEKPETFFRSFLVVALAEALAIYGLIIGILLWLKL